MIIIHILYLTTTMFKLLTKPTQFTKGKTEDTLCDISKRYLLFSNETNNHLIDIIVTNKSLPETEQWKSRTVKNFKNIKNIRIDILSSKSDNYNSIDSYIYNILSCKTKEELPNILIMCFHTKRVCDDLIKMFNVFGGSNYLKVNSKINFHISFDEVDANLGVTKKFIKRIKPFIDNSTIIGILLITATPIEELWKMLIDSGIKTLLNMNFDSIQNFDDELNNYRPFKEHNFIEHNYETTNPLHYITDVFNNKLINENERNIIFAPAHQYTEKDNVGSHLEVTSYFNNKNYCVLLMNGKFKGFKYPDKTEVELSQFNIENNITDDYELRDTLVKWNELNPKTNLAITGYNVIERGITLNTTGFNFTHMILSHYHITSIGKASQIGGRGSGGKDYVKIMNIICPKTVKEQIIKFNDNIEQICSLNPEYFNRTDFVNTNNTIPVKMIINDTEILHVIIHIRNESKRGYKEQFHKILMNGIENKKISIFDRNNIKKFDIYSMKLNQVRMYKEGDKKDGRRFYNFNKAYENYKSMSQSADENQYNIDFAKDKFIQNDFVNEINTLWITFRC